MCFVTQVGKPSKWFEVTGTKRDQRIATLGTPDFGEWYAYGVACAWGW